MRIISLFCILFIGALQAQTPDIYNINAITEIKLYFKEKNWHELLDSLKRVGQDERLVGDLVLNGKKYEKVGVRYKGNSSFKSVSEDGHKKLPFNIKVNEFNKKQTLPGNYNTLKLSNSFRDPSFVREVLAYEIAHKYMPAPKANFAKVYVNDQYLGVYHNVESIDDPFLLKRFKEDKGVLVKCDPDWTVEQAPGCRDSEQSSLMYIGEDSTCYMRFYEMKDKNGWQNFIHFTKTLTQEPDKIAARLNVDQTLWMLAFNNVLVNLDSYTGLLCHNYYLYRDTLGVYHPLVWDMNMAFGGFRRLNKDSGELSTEALQRLSPFVHYTDQNARRPLILNILKNDLYRKIYVAHIKTIVNDYFANGLYLKRAQELQQFIDKHIQADPQKLYAYENFKENLQQTVPADDAKIVGIAELMNKRTEFLLQHPLLQKEAPKIASVTHQKVTQSVKFTAKATGAQKMWLFYKIGNQSFAPVEFASTDQIVWTASLDYQKNMQYYIVAEDERTASLSPARAAFEWHKVDTATPVKNK
jgi:hypothetical protein